MLGVSLWTLLASIIILYNIMLYAYDCYNILPQTHHVIIIVSFAHKSFVTLIGVHEIHGRMYSGTPFNGHLSTVDTCYLYDGQF